MKTHRNILIGSTAIVFCCAAPAFAQETTASPQQSQVAVEDAEITVIGSRGKARTDVDRPVPVDVVSAQELTATGQTDLGQQIQFTSPSFNSAKYGVNGATNFADPASLRGLAPDQVLLLINGRRRHQFSALNLNVSPGLGTVVSDLNSIPTAAVGRIEVLRDGAAAQYGSDAIAGIVNLVLKNDNEGGSVGLTTGINKEGDGFTIKASVNQGLKLGDEGGFINYTLEYFGTDGSNRSDPYDGVLYPATPANYAVTGPTPDFPYSTANPRADRGIYPQGSFVVGNYGSNRNRTYQAFVNSEAPLTDTLKAFVFGGYSRKDIQAFGFFRAPATRANAVLSIFPDGYVPILPGRSIDYSWNSGLKAELGGWKLELGYGFGRNYLDQFARNTVNASLGSASPTSFYVGRTQFSQQVVELTGSKDLGTLGGIDSLNLAMGVQWRRDNFSVSRGDLASYQVGPLALSQGRTAGSNGRPGYAPADENNLSRRNIAAFVDIEADISDAFLITTALRYENYNDFGGNLSGKLAARLKVSDSIALRGSYNRGFRAPSLAQIGNRVNTSTVQNNLILLTQQIASSDPRLATLGIANPKAEISDNFSAGITGELGAFTFTADAFQIAIKDRIAITDGILSANFPAVAALFPGVREIRFFTNQIDTRTRGIDVVATYKLDVGPGQLKLTLAGTHAETKVLRQRATPAKLVAGASVANQAIALVGLTAVELIEVAQPRTKILFSTNFDTGGLSLGGRATYFGNVKAFSTGLNAADKNVACDTANRCVQTFGAKTIFDANATYAFTESFSLTIGANNLFDTYPDKWKNRRDGATGEAASYSNGQTPYTRNANQFGFNGSYYYLTANVKF